VSRLILSAWKYHQELEKLGIKYGPRKKLQKLLDNLKDEWALAPEFAALLQSISNVLERLKEMVLDLFDSVLNFIRDPHQASRSPNTSICNSCRAQKKWLSSSHMCYANWQETVKSVEKHAYQQNCKDMRKYARQVLLVVHPDKFDLLHPQCKQGSSAHLAAEFNNQYNRLKDKCKMK
jgi:hypothetical protein